LNNLALACFHCNRRKSNKISVFDAKTNQNVQLFNPRIHKWENHFIWSSDQIKIKALTEIGRVTITTLNINREWVISIRQADLEIGRHPPKDDPIEQIDH
jgi:hypothetical protein